jgi:glutathione S-transferase
MRIFLVLFIGQVVQSLRLRMLTTSTSSSHISPTLPSWEELSTSVQTTHQGIFIVEQENLRETGAGLPHTDAKIRLFGTSEEPRVIFFRDTAAWCPYCQKVWILLEEKKIPYQVQKVNMRSYGDKPAEFLRIVPNGLLPAISLDGRIQTDSLPIMMNLDKTFAAPRHRSMWPQEGTSEDKRAQMLMRLERDLFGRWCGLVFRPSLGGGPRKQFEDGLDAVDKELGITPGPWFLSDISIVDLTYISHIERMCASVAYWGGFVMRGTGRWKNIDRWMTAFEERPSYMASKSDYYTHVMDIPPQYGPGYSPLGMSKDIPSIIDGSAGAWKLPLAPITESAVEPVSSALDPGDESARHEAAYKLIKNHVGVTKFSLRGCGKRDGRFQAPLADPYAIPNLDRLNEMDIVLRTVAGSLLSGDTTSFELLPDKIPADSRLRNDLKQSLTYLRQRVGVPRDMSYPAARQLRAFLIGAEEKL